MDVTKSSGSCSARRGKHGGGHSEGVSDNLHGHWLVQETGQGSRRRGDPRLAVECGALLSWLREESRSLQGFSCREHICDKNGLWPMVWWCFLACDKVVRARDAWASNVCDGYCKSQDNCCVQRAPCLRRNDLRWRHRDGEPLVLCPSTELPLHATPRCAAASKFVLHGTTTGVSTTLTVRVDLEPKWLRRWCYVWREGGREGSEEEAGVSALRRPSGGPSRGPSGALLVLVRCLSGAFFGSFSGAVLWPD